MVLIPRPEELKDKLEKLKQSGTSNLHLIADFDKTLTKAFFKGKKIQSSYALIREGNYLTKDYPKRAFVFFDQYHPYEIDPNLSIEVKCQKMAEWWTNHWELMLECKMNKEVINEIVNRRVLQLREGLGQFFSLLDKNNIPLLVFSSGLGNIIEGTLKNKDFLTKNVHIVANFFQFDEKGIAISYKKPLIHVFNKNEVEIKNTPYFQEVKERKNVILLGDSLGDLNMSEGLEHDIILKIGFLNDKEDELLEEYKKHFDLIITDDGSLEEVNKLLQEIIGN